MIKFYYHPTPNPAKIALFLEEANLEYTVNPVDTFKGEQHLDSFRAINPNGKLPAIDDEGTRVFDSTAILIYLAEKTGQFIGPQESRGELLSWLMFIGTGLGPFSGQSVHFRHIAPEQLPYAINRYLQEAKRHYEVLDQHLQDRDYIIANTYTIADISAWGWVDKSVPVLGEGELSNYPNLSRWYAHINARPAIERARNVGKDLQFSTNRDETANKALFPHNYTNDTVTI